MPRRTVEEAHLFQARHPAAGALARIAEQVARIARLKAPDLDPSRAEAPLGVMRETLRVMHSHKELIEDALAGIDAATIARAAIHTTMVRSLRG